MSYILIFKQVLLGTPKEMHKEQKGENATRSNYFGLYGGSAVVM